MGSQITEPISAWKVYFRWLPGEISPRNLNPFSISLKAGFHQRRSRSRSRNQKGRAIRSSENQTDGVVSRTLILLMSPGVAYDQVKTALSESQAEAEE